MQQNPFSLYDFLGHLIPGVFFIFIITQVFVIDYSVCFAQLLTADSYVLNTILIVVFIVCAYIVGQFLSFISSRTVETYSNFKYKYPSVFLLNLNWNDSEEHDMGLKIVRLLIRLVILHVYVMDKFISYFIGNVKLINKPLDPELCSAVKSRINNLLDILDLSFRIKEDSKIKLDFNRIVMHYVYEYSLKHQPKLNNYVALYGFHRSLCLIFNITAWFFFINIFHYLHYVVIWPYVVGYVVCMVISYLFFISFMKFYRRFTLESFMVIVVDDKIVKGHVL